MYEIKDGVLLLDHRTKGMDKIDEMCLLIS